MNTAAAALKGAGKDQWNDLLKKTIAASPQQKAWTDSAIVFWDKRNRPDIAAAYARKSAELSGNAKDWIYAGQRFYYAVRFVQDPAEVAALYSNAIASLQKGLQLDPRNVDAKIDLASCYVEGTSDPMKGIGMLRELEKTDSNNVKLQMAFAAFSARSQQWDKAIRRLEKVLEIDSTYIMGWLDLADAYERNGQIEESIKALENFVQRTDDVMAKTTISEYIIKLKKSQPQKAEGQNK